MGGKRVKTYRRRLLDALFKTYRILQIQNPVLNVATVGALGVIISIPWRPCKHRLCPLGCNVACCIGLFTDAIFISAWALTLSVQLDLAMQEPWYVGRTIDVSTLFCVSTILYAVLRQRTVVITEMENNTIRYEKNIIINNLSADTCKSWIYSGTGTQIPRS